MTVTLRDDYNETVLDMGDEGQVIVWTLGIRSLLHREVGHPRIIAPVNGALLVKAVATNVTWSNDCRKGGTVDLWYSVDGGLTWTVCAQNGGGTGAGQADDGLFAWLPPNVESTTCLLKIQMTADHSIFGIVGFFSLVAA